jgi:predicted RNA polymerase sigma factor
MTPIHSGALAAAMMVALHASGAAAQSADTVPAIAALATVPSPLSPDELVRLHVAVVSLMTHPTSDALATIQELRRLMISRLEVAGPVTSAPAARN